jgi:hypothetical protein
MDPISFEYYPDELKKDLIESYLATSDGLVWRTLIDKISKLNRESGYESIKSLYSDITSPVHIRMLVKWVGDNVTDWLLSQWNYQYFFPFLPLKISHNVLEKTPYLPIVSRLSSTLPNCVSFTYYKHKDRKYTHIRMYFDPEFQLLVPESLKEDKNRLRHPLTSNSIQECCEKIVAKLSQP